MLEIKIRGSKDIKGFSHVQLEPDNIPAVDIPYYVVFEGFDSGQRKLEFQFLNNTEPKDSYIDEYIKIIFGKKSGKIYEFEINQNSYINSNKIRQVKRAVLCLNNDHRYKNNITSFLNLIKIFFKIEDNDLEPIDAVRIGSSSS